MARAGVELSEGLARIIGAALPFASSLALVTPRLVEDISRGAALSFAAAVPLFSTSVLSFPYVAARLRGQRGLPPSFALLTGALFSLTLVALAATGGAQSPLLFVPLAVGVSAGAILRPNTLGLLLPACLFALAATLFGCGAPTGIIVVHSFLLGGFSMLGRALLFGAVQAAGQRADARVDAELLRWYDDARLFRLLGAQSAFDEAGEPDDKTADKRVIASAEAVRDGLYRLLRLGHYSLSSSGGFVYLSDPMGEQLCLKEQLLDVDEVCRDRLSARAGPLSLALKKRRAIRLCDAQNEELSNHRTGTVKSLIVVPLMERAGPIGIVGYDRSTARPFSEADEITLLSIAEEMVHVMRTERVLHSLDEESKEKTRVFTAARAFGGVLKKEEAVRVALKTVQKVAPCRAAAFAELVKTGGRELVFVRGVAGEGSPLFTIKDSMSGLPLDPESWVGRAILQGTLLPHTPLSQTGVKRGLFTANDERTEGFGDVRALPLFAQGERVGALVVASAEGVRFSRSHLGSIGVIADLAGVAFAGAGYYETLEKAATTDGLTGLFNRRTLNDRFADAIARAERTSNPLSVILGDVDHFKSVNDTYGHQVGDDVLVGVARTLMRCARVTDIVARYGGEEFCLVCEHTDASGAAHLAERIRRSIAQLRFDTDLGPLEVTSSFGVAALGDHGEDLESVLKSADEALYRAKEKGRNRVIIASARTRGQDGSAERGVERIQPNV
ncbi:MAG: diguanylate cyclase [Myxococcota bacterium]